MFFCRQLHVLLLSMVVAAAAVVAVLSICVDAFVMFIDYLFRVVHAAVIDLDGVPVEDFS